MEVQALADAVGMLAQSQQAALDAQQGAVAATLNVQNRLNTLAQMPAPEVGLQQQMIASMQQIQQQMHELQQQRAQDQQQTQQLLQQHAQQTQQLLQQHKQDTQQLLQQHNQDTQAHIQAQLGELKAEILVDIGALRLDMRDIANMASKTANFGAQMAQPLQWLYNAQGELPAVQQVSKVTLTDAHQMSVQVVNALLAHYGLTECAAGMDTHRKRFLLLEHLGAEKSGL